MGGYDCVSQLTTQASILGYDLGRGFVPIDFQSPGNPTKQAKKPSDLFLGKIGLKFLQNLSWKNYPELVYML